MNTRSKSGARAKKEPDLDKNKKEEVIIDSADEEDQNIDDHSRSEEEPEYVPKSAKKKQSAPRPPAKKESIPRAKRNSAVQKTVTKKELKSEPDILDEREDPDNGDCEVPGYNLSEKEMKEVNHAFDMNQTDDELLTTDGLRTAMRSLGLEPRGDGIQKLMKKYAVKKGKVNRDGFHKIMALKYAESPVIAGDNHSNSDEISKVFNLLDLEKTGYITIDNLKSIAKELNEVLTDEELMEMICEADSDGDLKIDKEDFYKIMKKTNLY